MQKNQYKSEKKLLHYTGKAIADYEMIEYGDRVLVALSGGKDSFALANLLRILQMKSRKFELGVLSVNQSFPGWDEEAMVDWLKSKSLKYEIIKKNIYGILKEKMGDDYSSYCPLCSRLRRGSIYTYAKEHGFNKIALGHHRDDVITSLLMFVFYNGAIRSMPPKFLTDDKKLIVIRPLVYCQEKDISMYAKECQFPVVSHIPCQQRENSTRNKVSQLVKELASLNPKIPSNILNALHNVNPSQLFDRNLWDFKNLKIEDIVEN